VFEFVDGLTDLTSEYSSEFRRIRRLPFQSFLSPYPPGMERIQQPVILLRHCLSGAFVYLLS
jgi:hypothetical protein